MALAVPEAGGLCGSTTFELRFAPCVVRAGRGNRLHVPIERESGTGRNWTRQMHYSAGAAGSIHRVHCAASVETLLEAELFGIEEKTATGVRGRRGKFEHAHEGTLFLDEVSDLSPAAQAKLLRAIQDLSVERVGGCGARRVDTRIVVASNRSLAMLVEQGRFRLDLYYGLNGWTESRRFPTGKRCRRVGANFLERTGRSGGSLSKRDDALLTYDWPATSASSNG